jgi:hypothetical protein
MAVQASGPVRGWDYLWTSAGPLVDLLGTGRDHDSLHVNLHRRSLRITLSDEQCARLLQKLRRSGLDLTDLVRRAIDQSERSHARRGLDALAR